MLNGVGSVGAGLGGVRHWWASGPVNRRDGSFVALPAVRRGALLRVLVFAAAVRPLLAFGMRREHLGNTCWRGFVHAGAQMLPNLWIERP